MEPGTGNATRPARERPSGAPQAAHARSRRPGSRRRSTPRRARRASLGCALAVAFHFAAASPVSALVILHAAPSRTGARTGDGSLERPFTDLTQAVAVAAALSRREAGEASRGAPPAGPGAGGVVLRLAPGEYTLAPRAEIEPTCGNCLDPDTPVPFTLGLRISGRDVRVEGTGAAATVIRTRSGYGIFFQDCTECALCGVTVTGGARDTSGLATDAAIVVQRSSVAIEECVIRDNLGDPATVERTVVGIIGIAGRERSRTSVRACRIERNSWDGIALYRDAEAEITGNVIDGIDCATGRTHGGGRGVGIGLTWNARAGIRGNLVTRYWKGIGLFVDARAVVEENVVERIATWGLSLWDAGQGSPQGYFRGNAVDSTGACGAMIARAAEDGPDPGCLIGNAFAETGQNPRYDSGEPYCLQTAVALHGAPRAFAIEGNLFCANREADGAGGSGDLGVESFRRQAQGLCARLAGWPSLRGSRFLRVFGGTP
jgi:hypothetical protein